MTSNAFNQEETKVVISVQQTRSPIRRPHEHRETLIGLGLNRIGRVAKVHDTLSTCGMIAKVKHLVRATRFYFGDGTKKSIYRATDLARYLPPEKGYQYRDGYSMAESAKYGSMRHSAHRPSGQCPSETYRST
jgi:large subunit ribosomal protein L30